MYLYVLQGMRSTAVCWYNSVYDTQTYVRIFHESDFIYVYIYIYIYIYMYMCVYVCVVM